MPSSDISDHLGFEDAEFAPEWNGAPVPDCTLGRLVDGEIRALRARDHFAGAFTPVCTTRHLPEFIANAPTLRAVGYERLFCVAPNDPWTVRAWSERIDPQGAIQFLSDGNLAFARALGLIARVEHLFLGARSKRLLMTVEDGVVARIKVESEITDLSCALTSTLLVD